MKTNLTKFLQKHNFIVNVIVDQNVAEASYSDKFKIYYKSSDSVEGFSIVEIKYFNEKSMYMHMQSYAVRLYIILDIIRLCRQNNIPNSIIRYFDLNGKENLFENLFEVNLTEEDQVLEKELSRCVSAYLNNKPVDEKQMRENNLLCAFLLLKGLMK